MDPASGAQPDIGLHQPGKRRSDPRDVMVAGDGDTPWRKLGPRWQETHQRAMKDAWGVYSVLAVRVNDKGECAVPETEIADIAGISRGAVRRRLAMLVRKGFIEPVRRLAETGVMIYRIVRFGPDGARQPRLALDAPAATEPETCPTAVHPPVPEWDSHIEREQRDKQTDQPEAPNPPRGERGNEREPPPGFEAFWEAYPRKQRRLQALAAWRDLDPDPATVQAILLAVSRQRLSGEWMREDGRYIPQPQNYLRGRRWEDELKAEVANERTKYRYPEPP